MSHQDSIDSVYSSAPVPHNPLNRCNVGFNPDIHQAQIQKFQKEILNKHYSIHYLDPQIMMQTPNDVQIKTSIIESVELDSYDSLLGSC